jgi:hypothetical protein
VVDMIDVIFWCCGVGSIAYLVWFIFNGHGDEK